MKERIIKIISSGELKEAIELGLDNLKPNSVHNQLCISLLTQINSLIRRQNLGILSNEEYQSSYNKIVHNAISIFEEIEESAFITTVNVNQDIGLFERIKSTDLFSRLNLLAHKDQDTKVLILSFEQIVKNLINFQGQSNEISIFRISHGVDVIELIDKILPANLLEILNDLEITLVFLSALLHDIGFLITEGEKKSIINSGEFQKYLITQSTLVDYSEELNSDSITKELIHDYLLVQFLKLKHHRISIENIANLFKGCFIYKGVDYFEDLCLIISSHNVFTYELDSKELIGNILKNRFPQGKIIADKEVNIQFLCICLRIGDYLSFDLEKIPAILFKHFSVRDQIYYQNWLIHASPKNWYFDSFKSKLYFSVECDHPIFQHVINIMIDDIEKELERCAYLLQENKQINESKADFKLPIIIDRSGIRSKGFIFGDFKFHLDFEKIINLLTGEFIYDEKEIVLRELLQNAVDACRHRKAISDIILDLDYEPKIEIALTKNERARVLIFKDNGVGMDRKIIEEYFMRIGASYYKSKEFDKEYHILSKRGKEFKPISQFGIGILSCFLAANKVTVVTHRLNPFHEESPPLQLSLFGLTQFFVLKETQKEDYGTTIYLELKADVELDLMKKLTDFARHIDIPVLIKDQEEILIKNNTYNLDIEYFNKLPENLVRKLSKVSIDLSGRAKGVEGGLQLILPTTREGKPTFCSEEFYISDYGHIRPLISKENRQKIFEKKLNEKSIRYINDKLDRERDAPIDVSLNILTKIFEKMNENEKVDAEILESISETYSTFLSMRTTFLLIDYEFISFDGILLFANKRFLHNNDRFEFELGNFFELRFPFPKMLDINLTDDAKPRLNIARNGVLTEDQEEFINNIDYILAIAVLEKIEKGAIDNSERSKASFLKRPNFNTLNQISKQISFRDSFWLFELLQNIKTDWINFSSISKSDVVFLLEDDSLYLPETLKDKIVLISDGVYLSYCIMINASIVYNPIRRYYKLNLQNDKEIIYPTEKSVFFGTYTNDRNGKFLFIVNRKDVFNINHRISKLYRKLLVNNNDILLMELFTDFFNSLKFLAARFGDYEVNIQVGESKDFLRRIRSRGKYLEVFTKEDLADLVLLSDDVFINNEYLLSR